MPMLWLMRGLALAHYGWGFLLLAVGAIFGAGMLRVMPHLSSGTFWSNLPGVLLMAAAYVLPPAALGLWMVVLGRWAWTMRPRLGFALLVTHGMMLLPGVLSVVVGVHSMRAAEISTARGGGIMSPLAALPLAFGVPVLVLAICSIASALAAASFGPGARTRP